MRRTGDDAPFRCSCCKSQFRFTLGHSSARPGIGIRRCWARGQEAKQALSVMTQMQNGKDKRNVSQSRSPARLEHIHVDMRVRST